MATVYTSNARKRKDPFQSTGAAEEYVRCSVLLLGRRYLVGLLFMRRRSALVLAALFTGARPAKGFSITMLRRDRDQL